MDMEFIPLHFGNQLRVVNPRGTIGMVTLWSRIDYVYRRLEAAGVDLDPGSSPHRRPGHPVRKRTPGTSAQPSLQPPTGHPSSFRAKSLELGAGAPGILCRGPGAPGRSTFGVRGSRGLRASQEWAHSRDLAHCGRHGSPGTLSTDSCCSACRRAPGTREHSKASRVPVSIPAVAGTHPIPNDRPIAGCACFLFPEQPTRPFDLRTGSPDCLAGAHSSHLPLWTARPTGQRGEKRAAKRQGGGGTPQERDSLLRYLGEAGHTLEMVRRYEEDILSQGKHPDETYNYGHRMRAYFELDSLSAVVRRLREDPEDRKSYVVLWDRAGTSPAKRATPAWCPSSFASSRID